MRTAGALRTVLLLESPDGAVVLALVVAVLAESFTPLGLLWAGTAAIVAVAGAYLLRHSAAAGNLERSTGAGLGGWAAGIGLALSATGLTYLLGDPQPFCESTIASHRGCVTAYGFAAAVFDAVTVLSIALLAGNVGRYRRVTGEPVHAASDVDEGPSAVVGRVVPAGPTIESPVTGRAVVAYRHAVEEAWRPLGSASMAPRYRTVDYDGDAVDFYVEDGSGRLLVFPGEFDEHLIQHYWPAETVDGEETAAADRGPGRPETSGDRRHREWALTPDDVVFVAGRASEVDRANYPEPVVVGLDGPVSVAAAPRDEVVGSIRWRVAVAAVMLVLVGGGSFLVMLGTSL